MHILIAGCGYVGRRAAQLWHESGQRVSALTRSPATAAQFAAAGYVPIVGDVRDPATRSALPAADVLLIALTHDPASGASRRELLVDGVADLVSEVRSRVGNVIYVSSTGVYGQSDGSWVDETSVTEPTSEGGTLTLEAEEKLRAICHRSAAGCRLTVLRLAGIYGPGRLIARVDQLRSGAPVSGSPEAWLNLIHADDAARAIVIASDGRRLSETLLICDDRPLTRGEFYGAVAAAVGAPVPTFDPAATGGRRTSGLNKRCRNTRMHEELGIELQYPDAVAALTRLTDSFDD